MGLFGAAGEGVDGAADTTPEGQEPVVDPLGQIEVAGASAPAQAASLTGSGIDLRQIVESIHATVELAARRGSTQARIVLEPEELGQMSIHLSQTGGGLLVRVTADTQAGAQALAESQGELRHSLSSLGVSLRLDVGSSAAREGGESFADRAGRSSFAGPSTSSASEEGEDLAAAPQPARLARGELVDVLA